jgi:hypothetical protein
MHFNQWRSNHRLDQNHKQQWASSLFLVSGLIWFIAFKNTNDNYIQNIIAQFVQIKFKRDYKDEILDTLKRNNVN